MDEQQISQIVQRVLERLGSIEGPSAPAPVPAEDGASDLSREDLKAQYLVDRPHDREAFLSLRSAPLPAWARAAPERATAPHDAPFMADHAAAQTVFSDVDDATLATWGF